MKILGISGSLRKNSINTAALRAAQQLVPAGSTLEIFSLAEIPIYNEDLRDKNYPAPVQKFRDAIKAADAVVIACPSITTVSRAYLKTRLTGPLVRPSSRLMAKKSRSWAQAREC